MGRKGGVKCRCVALREVTIIRKEIFLRRLELRGREEEMENCVEVVSQDQESWTRGMRTSYKRAAVDVNVVEERMSVRWQV